MAARRDSADRWVTSSGEEVPADRVMRLLVQVLETQVRGWEPAGAAGPVLASLEYEVDGGGSATVSFERGGLARVSTIPGSVAVLAGPPPDLP